MPIWYRWADENYGSWHVDTLGRALLLVPAGIVALVAAAWFARVLGALSAWQVRSLLSARPAPTSPEAVSQYRRQALWIDGCTAAGLVVLTTIVWAATGAGYYWPQWVLLPLALLFAIHALVELVVSKVRPRDRAVAIHGGVVAAIFVFLVAVWALTSRGYFWPAWTLLGLASALVVHYLITRSQRRDRLARRVETLETTRAGRGRRAGRRAAPHRARPARRRAGPAGRARHEPRPGRAEARVRPGGRAAAGRRGARRRRRGAARAARPGPRHPPAGARRPRPRRGARALADRSAVAGRRRGRRWTSGRRAARSRRPRTSWSPRPWPTRPSTPDADRVDDRASARHGDARDRGRATTARAAPTRHGNGLAGLRSRVEALDGTLTVTSPAGGPTTSGRSCRARRDRRGPRAPARRAGRGCSATTASTSSPQVDRRRRARPRGPPRAPRPRDRRRPPAADLPRRGPAGGAGAARLRAGDRDPRALAVRRADVRRGAARRPGSRRRRLPAQGPGARRRRLRRRRAARRRRRHRARPRGRRPAPRRAAADAPARRADAARARGARADGRGPVERGRSPSRSCSPWARSRSTSRASSRSCTCRPRRATTAASSPCSPTSRSGEPARADSSDRLKPVTALRSPRPSRGQLRAAKPKSSSFLTSPYMSSAPSTTAIRWTPSRRAEATRQCLASVVQPVLTPSAPG